jgi:hypothetical protein
LLASQLVVASPIAAQASHQPSRSSISVTAEVESLFESDWVLMNWALKYFDANHDVFLEPDEARAAGDKFRQLADTNHDGRVTPEEYRAARALILKTN